MRMFFFTYSRFHEAAWHNQPLRNAFQNDYSFMATGPQPNFRYPSNLSIQGQAEMIPPFPQTSSLAPAYSQLDPALIGRQLGLVSHNPFKDIIHSASLRGLPGCPPGTHGKGLRNSFPIQIIDYTDVNNAVSRNTLHKATVCGCLAWRSVGK